MQHRVRCTLQRHALRSNAKSTQLCSTRKKSSDVWDQERALGVHAEEAREEGMEKGMVSSIGRVMKSLNLPLERAMDVLQIPAAERAKYAALVKG